MNRVFTHCQAVRNVFARLLRDEKGATAVEYGLLVGLIVLATAATLLSIGEHMRDNVFNLVSTTLKSVLADSGGGGGDPS